MSSTDDSPLPTNIHSLATELITRIVHLSSPKPSWDNATERSTHLRNLSFVCQSFRGPAQDELFRHVVLRSITASQRFVAVLRSPAGARFVSMPRSLRAGGRGYGSIHQGEFGLTFIAKRCSRLESMWLCRIDTIDIAALASGTGLTELFCTDCGFATALQGREVEALSLTRLGMRDCTGAASLNRRFFANVISLDISLANPDDSEDVNTFANSLGEQLSSLCVGDAAWDVDSLDGFEPLHFKKLLSLDARLYLNEFPLLLSSLPSHIRHLRVQAPLTSGLATSEELHYPWASAFIRDEVGLSANACLERLEHVRYGTVSSGLAMSNEREKELEGELKALRLDTRLSFDDQKHRSSQDNAFNPAFWAFVDDAEAEEAKRLEGI